MTTAWLWQWKHDHPAVVDVVWSYLTPALAVGWIFLEPETLWTRKLLVAVPIAIWGIRLGTYLQNRLKHDGSDEDTMRCQKPWENGKHWDIFSFINSRHWEHSFLHFLPTPH